MTIDTKALQSSEPKATVALVRRYLAESYEASRAGMTCGTPKAVRVDCAMVERLCRVAEKQADRLAALEAENAQLREAVAGKLTDEVVITDILIRNGMSISLEGGACHLLAEVFAKQLADSGAENYIEMSFQSKTYLPGEQLVVTLRRCKGKTPHQFRTEAEQKAETLEADNQQLRGLLSDVVSVAITMLYSSHKDDTLATFSVPELNDVVARSEHLQPERVEHIYRRGYEALAAGGVK